MNSTLPSYTEEENLVECFDNDKTFLLHPDAKAAWEKLKDAALSKGIHIYIVSAFRSIARQSEIIENKRAEGLSEEDIFKFSAPPGYSEHHTGKALDLTTSDSAPLEEEFERTSAFEWLIQHAGDFGFRLTYPRNNQYHIGYEPWHWFCEGSPNNPN